GAIRLGLADDLLGGAVGLGDDRECLAGRALGGLLGLGAEPLGLLLGAFHDLGRLLLGRPDPVLGGAVALGHAVAELRLSLGAEVLGRALGGRDDLGHARRGRLGRRLRVISHKPMVFRRPRADARKTPQVISMEMAERRYEPKEIEPRWQELWEREGTWEVSNQPDEREKSYVLEMLPYPSGEPHIGHLK